MIKYIAYVMDQLSFVQYVLKFVLIFDFDLFDYDVKK